MRIKNLVVASTLGLGSFLIMPLSYAVDLMEVYQQAFASDPELQSSKFNALANKASIGAALSPLLPQASYSYSTAYNETIQGSENAPGVPGNYKYNTHGWNLQVTQTLFDYANWKSFQESRSTAKAAMAGYNAAIQKLMVRTAKAYFDVLLAQDILRYTLAEKKAVGEQLYQTEQQYEVGLIAVTGVYQARAAYDDILAEEITARNNIVNAKEQLRKLTGLLYEDFVSLGKTVPLIPPNPIDPNAWEDVAIRQNYSIQSANYSLEAARTNVQEQRAGHLPTVSAVGSLNFEKAGNSGNAGAGSGFSGADYQTMSGGIVLEVPILSGGNVLARTKEAAYLADQSASLLEKTRREVIDQARESYNNVMAGISRLKADKQSIISNESSLQSTEAAYKVGTNTILDVLQAQQDLYDAQRLYSTDIYDYLNAVLSLKEAAGTISEADLAEINSWMVSANQDSSVNYRPELPKPPLQGKLGTL